MRHFFTFCVLIGCSFFLNAQSWQSTIGSSLPENKWAVIEDKQQNRFVTIGNSLNVDNVGRLWIASYSPTGQLLTSALANNGKRMIARDICLAPPDVSTPNNAPTYYVTGLTISTNLTNQVSQSFIGRINLNGVFLWYRESPFTTSSASSEEGVAVAMASNGDAVFAGHFNIPQTPTSPGGVKIKLSRFSSTGAQLWSNIYNSEGNWKVREIANGASTTVCASPFNLPGEFLVVGDVTINTTGGITQTQAFSALYNGSGTECWKSIYPPQANLTTNITASGAYDAALINNEYVVAGVAQFGGTRGSSTCTPYFYTTDLSGALKSSAVYTNFNNGPLGLYPRSITIRPATDAAISKVVAAGPSFNNNSICSIMLDSIGGIANIKTYAGGATANTGSGPFFLDDGPSEGILFTTLGNSPGYLISTNAAPGVFGNGDAHLVRTDNNLLTPQRCPVNEIGNKALTAGGRTSLTSSITAMQWVTAQPTAATETFQQVFCRDLCQVTASYTFTNSGNTYAFTGSGTGNGTLSYQWIFGDGTTSNTQNATKTFAPGTYNVCLLVSNVFAPGDTCKTESCKTIIVANSCNAKANFRDSLICGKKVRFINESFPATTSVIYKWLFDDSIRSNSTNPTITFSNCGIHKVRLIVCTNNTCCDTITKTIVIPCCDLNPNFCLRDSSRYVTLTFDKPATNVATNYTVYLDGAITSWASGTRKLLSVGTHTICLKVSRALCPGDTCCATCCKTIIVSNPCSIVADFWYQVQSDGTVLFTNKTNVSSYTSSWNFGNGTTSTVANPTTKFSPGTYLVCLTSTQIRGTDTCISRTCKRIYIETPCKTPNKFIASYCLSNPLTVKFTAPVNTVSNSNNIIWNFGDGSSSTLINPEHTYNAPGTYSVCMYTANNDLCSFKSCYSVIVSTKSCDTSCSSLPVKPQYREQEIPNEMSLISVTGKINGEEVNFTEEVSQQKQASEPLKEDKVSLFPNPASQMIQVVVETGKKSYGELLVLNSMGSIMYKKPVQVEKGKNNFSIPVQSYAAGNYYLKLIAGEKPMTSMFTVKN